MRNVIRFLITKEYDQFLGNKLFQGKLRHNTYRRFYYFNILGICAALTLLCLDVYRWRNGFFEQGLEQKILLASHLLLLTLTIPIVFSQHRESVKGGLTNKEKSFHNRLSFVISFMALVGICYSALVLRNDIVPAIVAIIFFNNIMSLDPRKLILLNFALLVVITVALNLLHTSDPESIAVAIIELFFISILAFSGSLLSLHFVVQEFKSYQNLTTQYELVKYSLDNELKHRQAEIDIAVSSAQLNPHFLFNTLNSIKLYIVKNEPKKAAAFLSKFARLIRITLQNSSSKLVPLSKEVEFCKSYLDLERFRLKERFDYTFTRPDSLNTMRYMVPPLFCQVFLENAVWHGIMPKEYQNEAKGHIDISIEDRSDHLVFSIEDNGAGRPKANEKPVIHHGRKSMGLLLFKDRIENFNQIYGSDAEFDLQDLKHFDGSPKGTRVTLKFPKIGGLIKV